MRIGSAGMCIPQEKSPVTYMTPREVRTDKMFVGEKSDK